MLITKADKKGISFCLPSRHSASLPGCRSGSMTHELLSKPLRPLAPRRQMASMLALSELSIDHNYLKGSMPEAIQALSALQVLLLEISSSLPGEEVKEKHPQTLWAGCRCGHPGPSQHFLTSL